MIMLMTIMMMTMLLMIIICRWSLPKESTRQAERCDTQLKLFVTVPPLFRSSLLYSWLWSSSLFPLVGVVIIIISSRGCGHHHHSLSWLWSSPSLYSWLLSWYKVQNFISLLSGWCQYEYQRSSSWMTNHSWYRFFNSNYALCKKKYVALGYLRE